MTLDTELNSSPENLRASILEIYNYYAALALKYEHLAQLAKAKQAHAEALLKNWQVSYPQLPSLSNSAPGLMMTEQLLMAQIPSAAQFPPSSLKPPRYEPAETSISVNQLMEETSNSNSSVVPPQPQTRTMAEVVALIGCDPAWCQRLIFQPDSPLKPELHYLLGQNQQIYWTNAGVEKLQQLHAMQQPDTATPDLIESQPQESIPTKQVSQRLDVSKEWISKAKSKYSDRFIDGVHYYRNESNRYFWTEAGIELLGQIKQQRSKSGRGKAKKTSSKPKVQMVPQYQNLTKEEAIAQVLADNSGAILHTEYIAKELYGNIDPDLLREARVRLTKVLSAGKRKGKWDSVPGELGCYTWDLALIENPSSANN